MHGLYADSKSQVSESLKFSMLLLPRTDQSLIDKQLMTPYFADPQYSIDAIVQFLQAARIGRKFNGFTSMALAVFVYSFWDSPTGRV